METADNLVFRNSDAHGGALVGVAQKDDLDVCWCCHAPLDTFRDIAMGTAFVRLCQRESCLRAARRETEKKPQVSVLRSIAEFGKKLVTR